MGIQQTKLCISDIRQSSATKCNGTIAMTADGKVLIKEYRLLCLTRYRRKSVTITKEFSPSE